MPRADGIGTLSAAKETAESQLFEVKARYEDQLTNQAQQVWLIDIEALLHRCWHCSAYIDSDCQCSVQHVTRHPSLGMATYVCMPTQMQMLIEDAETQAQAAATAQKERDVAMAKIEALQSAGASAPSGATDAIEQHYTTVQGLETEVRV